MSTRAPPDARPTQTLTDDAIRAERTRPGRRTLLALLGTATGLLGVAAPSRGAAQVADRSLVYDSDPQDHRIWTHEGHRDATSDRRPAHPHDTSRASGDTADHGRDHVDQDGGRLR